jgi:ABC-type Zn2+ transport system substrate-binding protein/surface adhesin
MPSVTVSEDLAFVSDPAQQQISIVDLTKVEDGAEAVVTSYELPQVPNEVAVASGAVSEASHEHGDGEDGHDHGEDEGHDHEDGHEGHDH